jgi:hypothetical protein
MDKYDKVGKPAFVQCMIEWFEDVDGATLGEIEHALEYAIQMSKDLRVSWSDRIMWQIMITYLKDVEKEY